jgi:hypothetical protein
MMPDSNGFVLQMKQDVGFCQECGASLFWERLGAGTISIAAGMLDLAQGLKTIGHIYCSDKPAYYEIVDDCLSFLNPLRENLKVIRHNKKYCLFHLMVLQK